VKVFRLESCLLWGRFLNIIMSMALPSEPVTLSVEQLSDLNKKLSAMRHDINNHLSLIVAALELVRHKPQMAERMLSTLSEQPAKIGNCMTRFSSEFERTLHITRP
jgi:aspartokinase